MKDIFDRVGVIITTSSKHYGYLAERKEMSFSEAEELLLDMHDKTPEEREKTDFIKDLTFSLDRDQFISKYDRRVMLKFDKEFIDIMQIKYPQYDLFEYRYGVVIFEQDFYNPKILLN